MVTEKMQSPLEIPNEMCHGDWITQLLRKLKLRFLSPAWNNSLKSQEFPNPEAYVLTVPTSPSIPAASKPSSATMTRCLSNSVSPCAHSGTALSLSLSGDLCHPYLLSPQLKWIPPNLQTKQAVSPTMPSTQNLYFPAAVDWLNLKQVPLSRSTISSMKAETALLLPTEFLAQV